MKLGFSAVCINPEVEVELSGYGADWGRKATGVEDNIYARALYIGQEPAPVLIISCDVLGLNEYVVNAVRAQLCKALSVKEEQIILSAIHTHTAPATALTVGAGAMNWDYIPFFIDKIVEAGKAAAANTYNVTSVSIGQETLVEPVGYNRAYPFDDPNAPKDDNVYVVRFDLEGEKPYLIINYSCHPVVLGPSSLISPDYPGEVITAMAERGCNSIFLNGCCGDINPIINHIKWGSGTKETAQGYARSIAATIEKVLENMETLDPAAICAADFTFTLETQELTFPEMVALSERTFGGFERDSKPWDVIRRWYDIMKRRLTTQKEPYKETIYVQAFRMGKLVYIAAQGELFTQIGADVRAAFPDSFIIFAANANAANRYVGDDRDIELNQYAGGFESCIVYGTLPPKLGTLEHFAGSIIKNVKELLPS